MSIAHAGAVAVGLVMLASSLHAQTINVGNSDIIPDGTDLPDGATVNVTEGGVIGLSVDLSNGFLNISGGEVALGATGISTGFTNSNNVVSISGGNVGPFFQFFNSSGTITGGTLETFGVFSGSNVTVSGGTVTGFADVFSNGVFNLEGGEVASIRALAGSTINIIGTSFEVGGSPVELEPGETVTLTARNQDLSATLADGSVFTHPLISANLPFPTPGVAVPSATITLTLVAPPCAADVNADGAFNNTDINLFVNGFVAQEASADLNDDGLFNNTDINLFVSLFLNRCGE